MQLYGKTGSGTYGMVDDLTMTYAGNQLIRVDEGVFSAGMAGSEDFKNFTNQATEYTYNKNGALTKDLNKGITEIRYNSVHLPRQMDIKSPLGEARNEYVYAASGVKLQVIQRYNSAYSKSPVIGSAVNTTLMDAVSAVIAHSDAQSH